MIRSTENRYTKFHDSRPPAPSTTKGNNRFEILFVKLSILKQKTNQILLGTIGKIRFGLFKKTCSSCSSDCKLR